MYAIRSYYVFARLPEIFQKLSVNTFWLGVLAVSPRNRCRNLAFIPCRLRIANNLSQIRQLKEQVEVRAPGSRSKYLTGLLPIHIV